MMRGSWRSLYVLGFLLYALVNAIVMTVAGATGRDVLIFTLANAVPPGVLGLFVVRYFSADRSSGAIHHLLFGIAFAVASVAGTQLIAWIGLGERYRFRSDISMWTLMIAGLVFLIVASAAHLYRAQSALALERERAAAAEALRAKAELAALRARIDPHFLFNTLHSVLALVRQDPFRAEEAIEQFADILRYTFAASDGSEERTLAQEWELVQNYLALERLRLGARLRVTGQLDAGVAGAPLPVLTLQPLVENAIRHAIAPRAGGGSLEIVATRCDRGVRIDVCDDGPGIAPDATPGRGLHLVRERLDRMYRGQAVLELGTSDQGGLRVTIYVPL
jgi:LytS/YehU family sensor histidine kinase